MGNWLTSPYWDPARRSGFRALAYAEVWRDGGYVQTVDCTGGTVTVDETAKVRRSLSISLSDLTLDPKDATDLLAPFGTELHAFAGMEYSGTSETVPVGVFALETTGRQGWTSELALTGYDRMGVLAGARFLQPWSTIAGTRVVDEIAAMILSVLPDVAVYDLTGSDASVRAATWDKDRTDAIGNLASGIGAEVFFDQQGNAIIRPVPTVGNLLDADDAAYLQITSNTTDADMLDVATGFSSANVYNAVVAYSDQENNPTTAIAYQATGPLRYRTGFQRPRFYSTPVVQSYDGMAQAAASILAKSVGYHRTISPTIIADPSQDAGSACSVLLPDGTSETRILSSFSLDLGGGSMACTTRVDPDWASTDDPGSLD